MTSLSSLETLEPDALLNLVALLNASRDPKKINLSVGAYRDENGQSKVLDVVREVCSFFDSTLFVLKPLLEQTVLHNHVLIRICTHFTFAIMCIVFILFVCLFVVCLFCFVLFCARAQVEIEFATAAKQNKEYLPITGLEEFCAVSRELMFGAELVKTLGVRATCNMQRLKRQCLFAEECCCLRLQNRITSVQSLSGTGAVRLGMELVKVVNPSATFFIPNPTWRKTWPGLRASVCCENKLLSDCLLFFVPQQITRRC